MLPRAAPDTISKNVYAAISNIKMNTGNTIEVIGMRVGGEGTFGCHISAADENLCRSLLSSFFAAADDEGAIRLQFLARDFHQFKLNYIVRDTVPSEITKDEVVSSIERQRKSSVVIAKCLAQFILKLLYDNQIVRYFPADIHINPKPLEMKMVISAKSHQDLIEVIDLNSIKLHDNGEPVIDVIMGNSFSPTLPGNGIHLVLRPLGTLKSLNEIRQILGKKLNVPHTLAMLESDIALVSDLEVDKPVLATINAKVNEPVAMGEETPYMASGLFNAGLRMRHATAKTHSLSENPSDNQDRRLNCQHK